MNSWSFDETFNETSAAVRLLLSSRRCNRIEMQEDILSGPSTRPDFLVRTLFHVDICRSGSCAIHNAALARVSCSCHTNADGLFPLNFRGARQTRNPALGSSLRLSQLSRCFNMNFQNAADFSLVLSRTSVKYLH